MTHRVATRLAASGALLCLLSTTALSQVPIQSSPASVPAAVSLPEVVVTGDRPSYAAPNASSATRTDTPILQIPQSVQVLPRTLLDEQDRRTLADALPNVSGVVPSKPEEAVLTQPIVRAFPAEIYVDGLPAFGLTSVIDPTSLVNYQRIEVVKGPTSTVAGGGVGAPLGGLINLVSKAPEPTYSGFVAMRGGSFGTVDPFFDVNVPFGSTVQARLTGEYQGNDSWIDRVRGDRWSLAPSVRFALSPDTELIIRGQFDHRSQLEYSGIPTAQAVSGQISRFAFPGAVGQPSTVINNDLVTADLRHRVNDSVEVRVTGRYYWSDFKEYGSFVYPNFYPPNAATPTTYPLLTAYLPTTVAEWTTDAHVLAKVLALGGKHELVAGVNYDHTGYNAAIGFRRTPIGSIDLARPVYNVPFGTVPALGTFEHDRYDTIAGYIQDQATYGRLHLLGSLRYTRLAFRQNNIGTDRDYYRLTPRVGASFDVTDSLAVFAGYGEGFRGVVNYVGTTPPAPETSRQYEVGVKAAMRQTGLSGTVALFDLTRNNVAVANPSSPFTSIQTGQQRGRGVEADLVWEPTRSISVLANYAYTDATVTRDTVIPIGNMLPRVPRHSGRVAARYRVEDGRFEGLSFGAGVTAVSARQVTLPNTDRVPGYAVADAQASYTWGRYTVAASVVNLTNKRAFDPYLYLDQSVVIPVQPLSAFLTVKANL